MRSRRSCQATSGDHPRACGEHMIWRSTPRAGTGSSPRLRGTPGFGASTVISAGIIPALAGNTSSTTGRSSRSGDHPRACGEHCALSAMRPGAAGSSPRLRGTLVDASPAVRPGGIIPALAGNTASPGNASIVPGNHPRACGEHSQALAEGGHGAGSSPRLRGTLILNSRTSTFRRIIPALAGNTPCLTTLGSSPEDHPRACGEHLARLVSVVADWGSSPRLRGTRGESPFAVCSLGIIPALAGNTVPLRAPPLGEGDHPRACGEHSPITMVRSRKWGSSPRLRGTP